MPERCPLAYDEHSIGFIPYACRDNCQDKIDDAVRTDATEPYNKYPQDHDGCSPNCELEFAQDSIQKFGESALRRYVITDECTDCRTDYGERGFTFECPFN